MEDCLNAGATIDEIKEALKNGVVGGDSVTYPARGLSCML